MAVIQPYNDSIASSGQLNVQATPNAFGANVGQAVQQLGNAGMEYADRMYTIDSDNGKLWAAQQAADLQLEAQKALEQKSQTADPRDPNFKNFATDFTDNFSERASELMMQAPNAAASRALQSHIGQLRNSIYFNAARIQSGLSGEYSRELAEQGIAADADLVAADPSNENFDLVRNRRVDTIRSMETNGLNKLKWENETNNKLGMRQVMSEAARNPQGFLASLNLQGAVTTPRGLRGGVPSQAPTAQEVGSNQSTVPNDQFQTMAAQAGLTGAGLTLARAIYGQESSYGRANTSKPNYAGANGPMQITEDTFNGLKKNGAIPSTADFSNARDTTNAALVLLKQLSDQYGGDPQKVAAAYYAGPKAVNANGSINLALRDLKNADAPTVGGYISQVMSRMGATDPGKEVSNAPAAIVEPAAEGTIYSAKGSLTGWGYLSPEQKVQVVRMAEASVGKQAAIERTELERQIKDRTAMLAEGKLPGDMNAPQFSRANMIRLLGADAGGRTADAWAYQTKVGEAMAQVQTMTPAQITATAATLEPTSADGFAERAKGYNAFLQAAAQIDTARQKDPMSWAIQHGINDVKPLPLNDFNAMNEELKRRGVAAVNLAANYQTSPQILTKEEASAFTEQLSKFSPAAKVSMLKSARSAFGTDTQGTALFQKFTQQISEKTPMVGLVGNLLIKPGTVGSNNEGADSVASKILEGEYILRGRNLNDPSQTTRPMEMDDTALRTAFNTKMGNAFRNLNGQFGFGAQTEMYQAVKNYLAAEAYHNGEDIKTFSSSNVEKAITAVSGGLWNRSGDTLMAPWGYPMQKFQDEFNSRAQAALDEAGIDIRLSAFRFDNLGDGKYAFRNGSGYLLGKDGKAVSIDYSKPLVVPPTAQSTTQSSESNGQSYLFFNMMRGG